LESLCWQLMKRGAVERPNSQQLLAQFPWLARKAEPMPHAASATKQAPAQQLFGRSRELQRLQLAFDHASHGRASFVCVQGESGVGKTALCEAFLATVESSATAISGKCFEQDSVPYKALDPLVDALSRHLRKLSTEEAAALIPRDARALGRLFPVLARVAAFARAPERSDREVDAPALRAQALSALLELFGRLRDHGPLLLWIDDLHWTDHDSIDLLRSLFLQPGPPALLVLISSRSCDSALQLERVLEVAVENRDWETDSIRLESLAEADTAALAAAQFGAGHDAAAMLPMQIARQSQGNPFWARELCAWAQHADRAWNHEAPSIAALVRHRIDALPLACRELVYVAALSGVPLPLDIALMASNATHRDLDVVRQGRLVRTSAGHDGSRSLLSCFHDQVRECNAALARGAAVVSSARAGLRSHGPSTVRATAHESVSVRVGRSDCSRTADASRSGAGRTRVLIQLGRYIAAARDIAYPP
jgi:hypothetical protein